MKLRLLFLTFVLTLVWRPHALHAEDQDFRFQPPKPPPLDVDFDDEDDEEFGDDFGRPPTAPAGPAVINPGAAKMPEPTGQAPLPAPVPLAPPPGAGGDFGSSTVSAGKFRFKVVEGEYWEKGKKRARGHETHVDGQDDSRGGGHGGPP